MVTSSSLYLAQTSLTYSERTGDWESVRDITAKTLGKKYVSDLE